VKLDPSHLIAIGRALGQIAELRESLALWAEGIEAAASEPQHGDDHLRLVHAKINGLADEALRIHDAAHALKRRLPPTPTMPATSEERS
jgi:hypothetical protein